MNKAALIQAIVEALRDDFQTLRQRSRQTRAAGNDAESKAEGKYDTRSTEDNYLADGLARQARAAEVAAAAYAPVPRERLAPGAAVELGALVEVDFGGESGWFFLGPTAGGLEVTCEGVAVTVLTPDSALGARLLGLRAGARLDAPALRVLQVE